MQLNVFLTGATGYIGGAVADALLRAGHKVTGLARSPEAANKLRAKGITSFHGDLNSPVDLANAAAQSEAVIHAGTTNDGAIDQAAVRVMLDALRASGKPLLYTSGIWVLGDTGGKDRRRNLARESHSPGGLASGSGATGVGGARSTIHCYPARRRLWTRRRYPG
jgi:uncharacterized protein YbjT (DUF2867 family)